jgi:hypothetical protein
MPLFESHFKVLVPEKLSQDGLALMRSSLDVHERKGLSAEELLEIIPEYDALLVRSETQVNANLLRAARRLKVVARAGVGVDNVGMLRRAKPPRTLLIVYRCPGGDKTRNSGRQLSLGQYQFSGRTHRCLDDVHGAKHPGELCQSQRGKVGTKQICWCRSQGQNIVDHWTRKGYVIGEPP